MPLRAKADAQPSAAENAALARALTEFGERRNRDDDSAMTAFLQSHPNSPWRLSLLTRMGSFYYRNGYLTRALAAWEEAWALGKNETDPDLQAEAHLALGLLTRMHARIGHVDRLGTLLAEARGRTISGSAVEMLQGAGEGLWIMQNRVEAGFRCGPMALGRVLNILDQKRGIDGRVIDIKSTAEGTSLTQLCTTATQYGAGMQMAKRSPGAPLIFPAVVHWKVGHFASLSRKQGEFFLIDDPTFDDNLVVSQDVLETEMSGYFLVPAGPLPTGWVKVSEEEGARVFGRGPITGLKPEATKPTDEKCKECPQPAPMAQYNIHSLLVSLNVFDTPLGYEPAFGPSMNFTVTYNQREAGDPVGSTLGPKWTTNWSSYVQDDPDVTPHPASATLFERSGGSSVFTFPTGTSGVDLDSYPLPDDGSILCHKADDTYERRFRDGSRHVYSVARISAEIREMFLTAVVDSQGNAVTLTYDSPMKRLTTITDATGREINLSYSGSNYFIASVADDFGRSASFEYVTSGTVPVRLKKITDMIGITSEFTYRAPVGLAAGIGAINADFMDSLKTPYGTTTFAYGDQLNGLAQGIRRWLKITDPMGVSEFVDNRPEAPGISFSDPWGVVPSGGALLRHNVYLHSRNTYFWDKRAYLMAPDDYTKAHITHWLHRAADSSKAAGVPESIKAPLENRVWYTYPGQTGSYATSEGTLDQPATVARVLDSGTTQIYHYEYNSIGRVTKVVDPAGRETTMEYDSNDIDLLTVKQKTSGTTSDTLQTFSSYTNHQPQTIVDAASGTTTLTYNGHGQVTSVTNPKGEVTTYVYSATSPSDNNYGRVTSIVTGTSTLASLTYDTVGRVHTLADSEGYTLTYSYDNIDRVTQILYPDGTMEQFVYSILDPVWYKDRLNRWSNTIYDKLRRPLQTTDPANRITKFDWCGCGAMTALIDPNGNKTSFDYDIQSRLISKTYADQSTVHFLYENALSRLKKRTDAMGQSANYSYFIDDALQQVSYTGGSGTTPTVNFTRDAVYDRMSGMVDGTGTTAYSYVGTGTMGALKLASVDGPLADDTITYTYDELGRQIGYAVNGVGEMRTYDVLGRVNSSTNALGLFTGTYVGASNRLASLTYPNGQNVVYDYFNNVGDQRLKQIKNLVSGTSIISQFDYTYDAVGSIRTWKQFHSGMADLRRYDLGYDAVDQLTGAVLKNVTSGTTLSTIAYQYDKLGNRLSEQENAAVIAGTFNNLNQQLTRTGGGGSMVFSGSLSEPGTVTVGGNPATVDANNLFSGRANVTTGTNTVRIVATDASGNATTKDAIVTVAGGTSRSLTYDLNGNTTNDGEKTYQWDAENRLVKIVYSDSTSSEFTYDGLSRRVQIVEKDAGGSVTETRKLIWDGLRIVERRDGGNSVVRNYYSLGYRDVSGSVNFYYTKDHLGSIREIVSGSGTVAARYEYDLYGKAIKLDGSADADFLYTGHYSHALSGLYFAPYRAYDAELGRWLSRDPIESITGETPEVLPDGPNLYVYASNNIVNSFDYSGLSQDIYRPDPFGHGSNNDGSPRDPHVDRMNKQGQNVGRYNPDGSPRRGAPPVPRSDWGKLKEACDKLARILNKFRNLWITELLNRAAASDRYKSEFERRRPDA